MFPMEQTSSGFMPTSAAGGMVPTEVAGSMVPNPQMVNGMGGMPGMGGMLGTGGVPGMGRMGLQAVASPDPTAPQQQQQAAAVAQQQQQQQAVHGRTQYIQKQQRWLLFLRHCAKCTKTEQECQFKRSCKVGKELWQHILQCTDAKCQYPRCISSKDLLKHHQKCQNPSCPICVPVKEYVQRSRNHSGTDSSDSYKQTMDQVRFA